MLKNKHIIIILVIFLFRIILPNYLSAFEEVKISSNGKEVCKYTVEIADDHRERVKGLKGRKAMLENRGMLFIFDKIGPKSFWMKDTYLSLDILFINEKGEIERIYRRAEPCKTEPCPEYIAPEDIKFVLELSAGQCEKNNINKGDSVLISSV